MIQILILTIFILAVILAKLRGYKLKPVINNKFTINISLLILFQIIIYLVIVKILNYNVVQLQSNWLLRILIAFMFFAPYVFILIHYNKYIHLVISSCLIILGGKLNTIVMSANNGRMPVYSVFNHLTTNLDNRHMIGVNECKYKFLSDIFDVYYNIFSIGDLLIFSMIFVAIYVLIKESNKLIK